MRTVYYCFLLFFTLTRSATTVIEIATISELIPYLQSINLPGTLILFDIDNTLLRPSTHLGSDQWFYHYLQQTILKGFSSEEALRILLPLYIFLHEIILFELVEEELSSLIKHLQQHCWVVGITARSPQLMYRTVAQLKQHTISFTSSSFFGLYVTDTFHTYEGIVFCGGHNKGEVLIEICNHYDFKPHTLIVIDDKITHLQTIASAAQHLEIECIICARYGKCDEWMQTFDHHTTAGELAQLLAQYR